MRGQSDTPNRKRAHGTVGLELVLRSSIVGALWHSRVPNNGEVGGIQKDVHLVIAERLENFLYDAMQHEAPLATKHKLHSEGIPNESPAWNMFVLPVVAQDFLNTQSASVL